MAIDKINLVISSIKCLESNLSSFVNIPVLADIVKGSVLTEIAERDVWFSEDIDYVESLLDKIEIIESSEFFDLIFQMSAISRERSHGAAPLFKAYIRDYLYDSIAKQTGAKEIRIYKVKLNPIKWLYSTDFDVLGVCKNKYGSSRYQDLLIAGKLRS